MPCTALPTWVPSPPPWSRSDSGSERGSQSGEADTHEESSEIKTATPRTGPSQNEAPESVAASVSEESFLEHEADMSVPAVGVAENAPQCPPPDVLLCLDVEATCMGHMDSAQKRVFDQSFENEILELPVEVVDRRTGHNISKRRPGWRFHTYVRPEKPPTAFCTDLTGISEATLAGAPDLAEALRRLDAWLHRRGLVPWPMANLHAGEQNFIWVTDGNWDFGKFLWHNCRRRGIPYPVACTGWCDVRESYLSTWPEKVLRPPILQNMVKNAGLTWTGRPHSGHVDTKNLAGLVGVIVQCNPTSLLPSRCLAYEVMHAAREGREASGSTSAATSPRAGSSSDRRASSSLSVQSFSSDQHAWRSSSSHRSPSEAGNEDASHSRLPAAAEAAASRRPHARGNRHPRHGLPHSHHAHHGRSSLGAGHIPCYQQYYSSYQYPHQHYHYRHPAGLPHPAAASPFPVPHPHPMFNSPSSWALPPGMMWGHGGHAPMGGPAPRSHGKRPPRASHAGGWGWGVHHRSALVAAPPPRSRGGQGAADDSEGHSAAPSAAE
eukprot:TRINITY_DN5105_c0_g1_i1.p1 TRINITY_DN5105_c0_g1~~TRINITY_DN5105_c0_g1_i1.p1  ORF type:complete len:550 (+),score=123.86 TRINITY_DN5105_c0_g1_i1:115-1764(+)